MPKKKENLSQKEQSKRFLATVQELVDAGELSPTEAAERFERAMKEIARPQRHGTE
jgi:polyhydroxyalkanoate synthesis regulator phasin